MARVFLFILEAKHKTLHVIWAWVELEILQKKIIIIIIIIKKIKKKSA